MDMKTLGSLGELFQKQTQRLDLHCRPGIAPWRLVSSLIAGPYTDGIADVGELVLFLGQFELAPHQFPSLACLLFRLLLLDVALLHELPQVKLSDVRPLADRLIEQRLRKGRLIRFVVAKAAI